MKLDRDNAIAIIGTILFHLAIFVLMFFTLLKTVVPIEEEGILVNIGTIQTSAGFFESQEKTAPAPEPEPVPVPEKIQTPPPSVPTAKDELVTQDKEESLSLANRKKEKDREKRETAERKREAERKEREAERMAQEAKDATARTNQEEDRKKREAAEREREREREAENKRLADQRKREKDISDQMTGAFNSGNTSSKDESPNSASGETKSQGNPFSGAGDMGSFDLEGRSIQGEGLPRPAYNVNVEGRIVIDITVDPQGNVIRAEIGKGTTIGNASIRNSALGAARQAKFNYIPGGTNNQSGTITYRYSLK